MLEKKKKKDQNWVKPKKNPVACMHGPTHLLIGMGMLKLKLKFMG